MATPNNAELLAQISSMMDAKNADLKADLIRSLPSKTDVLDLKKDIREVRADILSVRSDVEEVKRENVQMGQDLNNLKVDFRQISNKLEEMDKRSRRNNLIIKGLTFTKKITPEEISAFFRDAMKVEVDVSAFTVAFSKVGAAAGGFVIVTFLRVEDKWRVLKQTRLLGGRTGISVDQDYPEGVREARSRLLKLRSSVRKLKDDEHLSLDADRIKWRGHIFTWDKTNGITGNTPEAINTLTEFLSDSMEVINKKLREGGRQRAD